MSDLDLRHVLVANIVALAVTLGLAWSIGAASGQQLDEPTGPDWRRPFVGPGTSFTGGVLDAYRRPDGGSGFGVETGGGYVYRDRQGSAFCTDTSGLVTCLGTADPDPAGFLDERR